MQKLRTRSRSLQSMHISRRETWQRLLDVAAQRLRLTIQGGIAMPFFKDIDDWREWNDNRYIDDPGEPEEEKEGESNEDE